MAKILITGGAGFIGSHLAAYFLNHRNTVTVVDNLSLGKKEFLKSFFNKKKFSFYHTDLLDFQSLKKIIKGQDVIFHMAANSDIFQGSKVTDTDLKQGTLATYHVLEAMRLAKIKSIVFASTSTIYGEVKHFPTPEDYGPSFPISFYGASKLACEGLISAYCHNFAFKTWIYRFANIVGPNPTHGIIFDFVHKLKKNPNQLEILGDGKQRKPYLHVQDCVEGIIYGFTHAQQKVNYFNLTSHGATSATEIANLVVQAMDLKGVCFSYTGGARGWPGDVPQVRLDGTKMKRLGWQARWNSEQAVRKAAYEIVDQLV